MLAQNMLVAHSLDEEDMEGIEEDEVAPSEDADPQFLGPLLGSNGDPAESGAGTDGRSVATTGSLDAEGYLRITPAVFQQMVKDVQQLRAEVLSLTQRSAVHKPAAPPAAARKPKMWDGKDRTPRMFLIEMKNYFSATSTDRQFWISQAVTFFSPDLQQWYHNYKGTALSDADLSWEDFGQILLKGHPGQEPQHTVRDRLNRLAMQPGKVQEFAQQFLALAREATGKFALGEVEGCGYIQRVAARCYPALATEIRWDRSSSDGFVPWDDYSKLLHACTSFDALPGNRAKAFAKPAKPAGQVQDNGGWQTVNHKKRSFAPKAPQQGSAKKPKGERIEVLPEYRGRLSQVKGLRERLAKNNICFFCRDHINKHTIMECPRKQKRDEPTKSKQD